MFISLKNWKADKISSHSECPLSEERKKSAHGFWVFMYFIMSFSCRNVKLPKTTHAHASYDGRKCGPKKPQLWFVFYIHTHFIWIHVLFVINFDGSKNRNGLLVFQFELVLSEWTNVYTHCVMRVKVKSDKITCELHLKQNLLNLERCEDAFKKKYTHKNLHSFLSFNTVL